MLDLANNNNNNVQSADVIENKSLVPRWYCLKTEPGKEYIVKDALEKKMKNEIIGEYILDVKIIEKIETIEKKTKVVKKTVNRYPNHIFIKFKYSKEMWWEVVSTEGAYSFLGPDARPQALRNKEVFNMGLEEKPKIDISEISVGDKIRITPRTEESDSAAFAGSETVISQINPENNTVKASIYIMGCETERIISIDDIEKI